MMLKKLHARPHGFDADLAAWRYFRQRVRVEGVLVELDILEVSSIEPVSLSGGNSLLY